MNSPPMERKLPYGIKGDFVPQCGLGKTEYDTCASPRVTDNPKQTWLLKEISEQSSLAQNVLSTNL